MVERLEDRTVPVVTNINITQTPVGGSHKSEGTIGVDPTNSNHLFAASNGGSARYSTNAGVSWQPSIVSQIPPQDTDPQATFDTYGNLYLTYMTDTDPDPNVELYKVVVAESFDAGASFQQSQMFGGSAGTDQPSIAAGPGGATIAPVQVAVSYQDRGSGCISFSAAQVSGFGLVDLFGAVRTVPGSLNANFGDIKIGPEGSGIQGHIMVTYQVPTGDAGPSQIYVNLAPPLLLPFGFGGPVLVTRTNVGGQFKPTPGNGARGIDAEANLAWDRSGNFHPGDDGRVYLVYVDSPAVGSFDTDIFVRHSDDSGLTWSERQRVNDDDPGAGQFMPQIAVNQYNGSVAVAWYDTRNDPSGVSSQLFASVSIADGPWLANRRISKGVSNAGLSLDPNGFGDYNTMDVVSGADGYFYPIWADNSPAGLTPLNRITPKCDMATAKVRFLDFLLPAAPEVGIVQVNDGTAQRSEVPSPSRAPSRSPAATPTPRPRSN